MENKYSICLKVFFPSTIKNGYLKTWNTAAWTQVRIEHAWNRKHLANLILNYRIIIEWSMEYGLFHYFAIIKLFCFVARKMHEFASKLQTLKWSLNSQYSYTTHWYHLHMVIK